jgi:hypothetical protein
VSTANSHGFRKTTLYAKILARSTFGQIDAS